MPLAVGMIADDLTGALDAAAPFAMRGLQTRVIADETHLPDLSDVDCAVLSINTGSRHLPAPAAAERVAAACRAIGAARPEILFKKVDSTLRGNVAVEILAAMKASGRREAVITPAMPAQGRTVRRGEVFVHGRPLAQSSFAHDVVSSPDLAPIATQLTARAPAVTAAVVNAPPPSGATGCRAWIADCETPAELDAIGDWAAKRAKNALMVGAAGLAEALAAHRFGPRQPLSRSPTRSGMRLYVVGSQTPVSRAQTAYLLANDPSASVLDAPAGGLTDRQINGLAAADGDAVIIRVAADGVDRAPALVAEALGESTARVLASHRAALMVATGGDTVSAILNALGIASLELVGEVLPGIPVSRIDAPSGLLTLVTKAGGFGNETLFKDLPDLLDGDNEVYSDRMHPSA